MGWLEDWGLVGSKGSAAPVWVPEVKDFRVPITDAQGKPNYRMPNPADRARDSGAYSVQEAQRRAAIDDNKNDRADLRKNYEDRLQYDRSRDLVRDQQEKAERDQRAQGLEAQITHLQNQGAAQQGQLTLQGQQLTAQTEESRENRYSSEREQQANRTQQLTLAEKEDNRFIRQMELNNELMTKRLGMEDRHFERQAALDERNARRTKVLGALTIIAQSLQRV